MTADQMVETLQFGVKEMNRLPMKDRCLDELRVDHQCSLAKGHPGMHMLWGVTQQAGRVRQYVEVWL